MSKPLTPPPVTGQCLQVLSLLRQHGSLLSLTLTADYAIPETAARIHDLRAKGFNVITTIKEQVIFRGCVRKRVANYSLGTPEWPSPDFTGEVA
ncbi:MAG: helix-turn-helix domain-containing protein [Moraxellaceae bacterium]|nr:helix-turn-helix domain-containing protein [Pseudomonadales bacterium]MCP5173753.1 helix-turn-helix domain-containing protein [Moraxellaceae bacterium]